jgi:hypothetical protein
MTQKALSFARIAILTATGLIAVSALSSCGSSARPRRGALAGAADTVAAAFHVQCNGPDACFGYRGSELGFFETTQAGDVKFVARRSTMSRRGADSLARHLRDSLAREYGGGAACPASISTREERQWLNDGRQVAIVVETGSAGDSGEVTIIERSTPTRCGVLEEPELFR